MKGEISIQRKLLWGLLALVAAGVVGVGAWTWYGVRTREGGAEDKPLEGLKLFGTVPDFSLIERSGRRVTLADLRGKVWVVLFFYTGCRETCPLIVPQMGLLHLEYKNDPEFKSDIRFVSITVDPERDTPAVLARYAERFSADPERWLFLTGERAAIYRLAQEGFRLGVGEVENPLQEQKIRGEKDILHSSRLVLVDRKARIRGYYPGIDVEAMVRLRRNVKTLLRTEGS